MTNSSIKLTIDSDWESACEFCKHLIRKGTQFSYHETPEGEHAIAWVVKTDEGGAKSAKPKEVG